jgi:flagellar biosynthesis protein FlhG
MAKKMEPLFARLEGRTEPALSPNGFQDSLEGPDKKRCLAASIESTSKTMHSPRPRPASLWAVGGAKGGVGKSIVALGLSSYLGMTSRDVLLVDGDLGAPNLHTLLGVRNPEYTLGNFMERDVEAIEEVLLETDVPGLRFMAGYRDRCGAANPKNTQKERLLRHLRALPADVIVLDLGAGTSFHVLDLFKDADRKIIVLTPEPTAVQNGFDFLMMAVYRQLISHLGRSVAPSPPVREMVTKALEGARESRVQTMGELFAALAPVCPEAAETFNILLQDFHPHLIVNSATERQARQVAEAICRASHDSLGIRVDYAGHLQADPEIARSVRRRRPFLLEHRDGERWKEMAAILRALDPKGILANAPPPSPAGEAETPEPVSVNPCGPATRGVWGNDCGAGRSRSTEAEQDTDGELDFTDVTDTPYAVGRNQNVVHKGKVYHVQTEDLGSHRQTVCTAIHLSGQLVFDQNDTYASFREEKGSHFTVQQMVDCQHQAIVEALQAGKLC